ncbi:peptidoglycan-binding domain-containing protein [Mobilibacterium timonense]|uniref:peptidoglycan-binding domain-containing protein n=1 Tax=Mobilibacterium timonense TaxID=1871012 RepID=UPI0013566EC0|nr:peptidoglycan-binding domain-containing protein [Mobilibacterium timonense]
MIVLHHWGSDGQTMAGVIDWFCRKGRGSNGTSAHYVVSGNQCACLVNEGKGAWHAGNHWYNEHSIGIEARPEMDTETYKTVIETVAMIYKHLGKVVPIIGHLDVPGVKTACPGRYYSHIADIQAQATALYQSGKAPTGPAASGTTSDGKLVIDGEFGSASCKRLQVWLGAPYRDGILSGQLRSQSTYIRNFKWCVSYASSGGSATVKLLQRKVGAGVDGYLGKETISKLQTWLNRSGYKLAVDGIAGPATCRALQQYLNAH